MAGHMSVVVRTPEVTYFLAGDATYDETLLKQRIVDGPSENIEVCLNTLDRIAAFARAEPTVLLPAHDPLAEHRLAERITSPTINFARLATGLPATGPVARMRRRVLNSVVHRHLHHHTRCRGAQQVHQ
jgi:glyoxylase-like metal-dependent hydrolase (beta-lactamase superfamily II)